MPRRRFLALACLVLAASAAAPTLAVPSSVAFARYIDRTEGAFLLLVPAGWRTSGGIVRLIPITAAGGIGNATGAKIDFAVVREAEGRAWIRWLPKINYAQPSQYNMMLGGNWNGMPVVAMPSAADYLTRMLFPSLHPGAREAQVIETQRRPDAIAGLEQGDVGRTMRSQGAFYVADACSVVITYDEGGVRYKEILFVALEGFNMQGVALWSNPLTIAARAPEAEYDACAPIARLVINSFSLNPVWLAAEQRGETDRTAIAATTLRDLARIDAEIARNRAQTMARINEQEHLALTSQEKYLNPHTGQKELGSNEWKHRWVSASGEQIYTNDGSWDPNRDPNLHVSGYQRSPVTR